MSKLLKDGYQNICNTYKYFTFVFKGYRRMYRYCLFQKTGDTVDLTAIDGKLSYACGVGTFLSRTSQTSMVFVYVVTNAKLTLRSLMQENEVIFSDGIEADSLWFSSGRY
jgi:hypothetical protein